MISIIIVIKNRTKFEIKFNNKKILLELFKNNLEHLMKLHCQQDRWELVVVDFNSDDVDMSSFLKNTITKFPYKHILLDGLFSKGKGLNVGFDCASYETLFFLDADIVIKTRKLFDDISQYCENYAMFPIPYSYWGPDHTTGRKRETSTGNAIYKKKLFIPYFENTQWGHEDSMNFVEMQKKTNIIRPYYEEEFIHQWHPDDLDFKNIFYKSLNNTSIS